jgi:hypothetical protein
MLEEDSNERIQEQERRENEITKRKEPAEKRR